MTILVVMGVSGSGKTTVAHRLTERLGWAFAEGDDLHPQANRDKMAAGIPLTDADRAPWLAEVRRWIDTEVAAGRDGVITCSALTCEYRDVLRADEVTFVHLSGPADVLRTRLAARSGHFMPLSLLESQLATLETPTADEKAVVVDIGGTPEQIADEIIRRLALLP